MRCWWLIGIAACYAPSPVPGAPCDDGRCPQGLQCFDDVCLVSAPLRADATDDVDGPPSIALFEPDSAALAIFELNGDVRDSSGNDRHAMLLGGSFVSSAWGQGLRLSAEDPQGFLWPHAELLVHPYTIELVVVPNDIGCYRKLFGAGDANDDGWYYCDGFVDHPATVLADPDLIAGARHYFALVSTSASSMDVYFNGVKLGDTPTSFVAPPPEAIFFRDDSMGGSPRSERLDGMVEAVRISSTARTAIEIEAVAARLATQP